MKITYTVEFFSYWHCGSGLAAGADVDALVIKDKNKLPYIPGKTIKGLIREAVEDIFTFSKMNLDSNSINNKLNSINDAFGYFDDKLDKEKGCMFFSNATLPEDIAKVIRGKKQQEYLYKSVSSTSIDDKGIAKEHSLRRIEVAVPCTLEGYIMNVPDDLSNDIESALSYIKRLGVNRNRGLGRCCFTIKTKEESK